MAEHAWAGRGLDVAAVLAAGYVTAGMGWVLAQPGFVPSRLALAAASVAFAVVGAAGTLTGRRWLGLLGGVGLVLLGFWQAVLWVVMLPAALVLLVAAALSGADDAVTPRG